MATVMEKHKEKVTLQFLGAAGTVTGSKYLLTTASKTILVDCGLFQGLKELRLLNWGKFPVDPSTVNLVLLTHGHLDHVGYLPRLVKSGFKGKIFGTAPTLSVAEIILSDSAKIQEEDAQKANEKKYSKHKPAMPLYDLKDVEKTIPLFEQKELNKWIELDKDLYCRFNYNGHILGATYVEIKYKEKIILFSGDIGRESDPLMLSPEKPEKADIVLIESTYGNKLHPREQLEALDKILAEARSRSGTVIIPSFAVERTQLLMYLIWQLKKRGKLKDTPVYMDSPMGTDVLDLFRKYQSWHKLSEKICEEMCREIRLVKTPEESISLAMSPKNKIIIAGSGMATGGRVLTYLQNYLGDANATILLAGYQAEGTRGRRLLDGEKTIKLLGKFYEVKANIRQVEGLSSHADQGELIEWLSHLDNSPEQLFIVHGERESSMALKAKIAEIYKWDAIIPEINQTHTFYV
jgi:metallo-beta-lactamase family protein